MTKLTHTLLALSVSAMTLGACATVEETVAEAVAETRRATLDNAQLVGMRGDSDGYARVELTVSDELDQVCYDLNDTRNLDEITGISIHRGAYGQNGPAVLTLRRSNQGGFKSCVSRSEWLEDSMERNPAAYYVQLATSRYPNGAIRGQFSRN